MFLFKRNFNILDITKIKSAFTGNYRCFESGVTSNTKWMKVAVLGAAGRTGSFLSVLLKQSLLIDELALYDTIPFQGTALELSHINTRCKVTSYEVGEAGLKYTVDNAKIIVITAGRPMKRNSVYEEVLTENANIISDLIPSIIRYSPRAMVAITTSPVNSLVPLTVEMYRKGGILDYNNIFGVTILNSMRANTFTANLLSLPPECVLVPVIGGSCSETCVPLFSQTKPRLELTQTEYEKLICLMKRVSQEVENKYNEQESLSLAESFAAARFCISLCKAVKEYPNIVDYAYVRSCVIPEVTYLTTPLQLGPCGIQKQLGIENLTEEENRMLEAAIRPLKRYIKLGEQLALGCN